MRNFKKFLALLLAALMVVSGMVTVSAAEEVAEAAVDYEAIYNESAAVLNELDILKGDGVDFNLDEKVLRYQLALFIARIMTGETSDSHWSLLQDNTTEFDDVTEYYGAISLMAEMNIIKGVGWIAGKGDNCFNPKGEITYAHALTMANRAYGEHQWKTDAANIEAAISYGLTEGLEPDLKADDTLNRGQVVQILYNLLFAKQAKDNESYASKNFGIDEKVYVVVATNLQHMAGIDRIDLGEESDLNVALAPLNADGTYDLKNVVYTNDDVLGADADFKMAYSYTISTYANGDILFASENTTKTFKNYGDLQNDIQNGSKYSNSIDNNRFLKVDGKTYSLVEAYTGTTQYYYNELIVHSMFASASDSEAFLYYVRDDMGNILDKENFNVAIYYNIWTDSYYVPVYAADNTTILGYKPATDADFAACAYTLPGNTSTDQFGIETYAKNIYLAQFSELTMIDDDNDGKYDRAVYIPYSVGKYTTHGSQYAWIVKDSAASSSNNKTVGRINGQNIYAYVTNTSGQWIKSTRPLQASDIKFNERPAGNEYIVYYYNPYTRDLTVVENLGKTKTGTVQTMSQGTYAYDGETKTYFYKGATATIDGQSYVLGYRTYESNSQMFKANASGNTDFGYIDSRLATTGYDTDIYAALLGQTYTKMSYLVLAGRLIYAGGWSNGSDWLAFDMGSVNASGANIVNQLLSATYVAGDIIGLSADNYIEVAAYTKDSGAQKKVKIATINGYDYGTLVMTYSSILGGAVNDYTTNLEQVAICKFLQEVTPDNQFVYVVTGIDEVSGAYHINTHYDLYVGLSDENRYYQPTECGQNSTITFVNGIATNKVNKTSSTSDSDKTALILDDESVIVVAGADGMKVATGIPASRTGAGSVTLKVNGAAGTIRALSLTDNLVFVASATVNCDDIFSGKWDSSNTTTSYTYYMVMGRSTADYYESETTCSAAYVNGSVAYTYSNIYNINTGEMEKITVVGGLPQYNSAYSTGTRYA